MEEQNDYGDVTQYEVEGGYQQRQDVTVDELYRDQGETGKKCPVGLTAPDFTIFSVCLRPVCGLSDKVIKGLIKYLQEEYEFATLGIEEEGTARHGHMIVNYASSNYNLRSKFMVFIKRMKEEHGDEEIFGNSHMLKIAKITRQHCYTIGYSQKDGDVRVKKGFTSAYLNLCKAEYKKESGRISKGKTNPKMVNSQVCWFVLLKYARDHNIELHGTADCSQVLVEMSQNGFIFINRRQCAEVIRQGSLTLNNPNDADREKKEWDVLLGVGNPQ